MKLDQPLIITEQFPRASKYHPEWVKANASGGANSIWLTEWPDNALEIKTLAADQGAYLGYVRVVGRRQATAKLEDYCWPDPLKSFPQQYTKKPLLRDDGSFP